MASDDSMDYKALSLESKRRWQQKRKDEKKQRKKGTRKENEIGRLPLGSSFNTATSFFHDPCEPKLRLAALQGQYQRILENAAQ